MDNSISLLNSIKWQVETSACNAGYLSCKRHSLHENEIQYGLSGSVFCTFMAVSNGKRARRGLTLESIKTNVVFFKRI